LRRRGIYVVYVEWRVRVVSVESAARAGKRLIMRLAAIRKIEISGCTFDPGTRLLAVVPVKAR
jgi:hypothetical protein